MEHKGTVRPETDRLILGLLPWSNRGFMDAGIYGLLREDREKMGSKARKEGKNDYLSHNDRA